MSPNPSWPQSLLSVKGVMTIPGLYHREGILAPNEEKKKICELDRKAQIPSQTGDFISIISPVASRVCKPEIHSVRAVVGALEVEQHCGVEGGRVGAGEGDGGGVVKRSAESASDHLHPNSALPNCEIPRRAALPLPQLHHLKNGDGNAALISEVDARNK